MKIIELKSIYFEADGRTDSMLRLCSLVEGTKCKQTLE